MKQYRIDFQWREANHGQMQRNWRTDYSFINAESPKQARDTFKAEWSSSNEFQILATTKCGAQEQ